MVQEEPGLTAWEVDGTHWQEKTQGAWSASIRCFTVPFWPSRWLSGSRLDFYAQGLSPLAGLGSMVPHKS